MSCPLCPAYTFGRFGDFNEYLRHFPLIFQQCFAPKGLRKYNYFLIFEQILKVYIMEKQCDHIGFIEEHENFYICTKCKGKAIKMVRANISGTWVNGQEPKEYAQQLMFEKCLSIQRENEQKKGI